MSQTQYLTLNQFAAETHRGTRYIKALTDSGEITTILINGHVYYLQSEVDKAKQAKPSRQADELKNLRKAFVEFINLTKVKFKVQAEEIAEHAKAIETLKMKLIDVGWDVDILNVAAQSKQANPAPTMVSPTTSTEPTTALELDQAILALEHQRKTVKEAEELETKQTKIKLDITKKEELSKINAQTKLNSTLKGQKQQEEDAAKQVRLAHRANLAELNRSYVATQTQLEEANHFLNVYLEDDGKLYYVNDPEGNYSILCECYHLITTNRELTHFIKKEYQHLYHLTESGIVDLVTGHSAILDFVPTLHPVMGHPVEVKNTHTINIPSTEVEAYPAAWYKFISDHPQPYQHEHNPPDIDLSYTDLDTNTPTQVALYDAALAVHQQQIDKWIRFRQDQGLL